MKRISISIFVLLVSSQFCLANNNYFIPGDAFFYFEIDQSEWEEFKNGKLTTWEYDRPEHLAFMLCGYAGYQFMDFTSLPADYRSRLIDAVDAMKQKYPSKMVKKEGPNMFGVTVENRMEEINKIRIFIYNKDFDFSKFRIGLKYNEDWPSKAKLFGFNENHLEHFQYDFFVDTTKGVAESWRMGSKVNALEVELAPPGTGAMKEPIKFEADKLQILVAPPISLETLCYPPADMKANCVAVSSTGNRILVPRRGKWNPEN